MIRFYYKPGHHTEFPMETRFDMIAPALCKEVPLPAYPFAFYSGKIKLTQKTAFEPDKLSGSR